MILTLERRGLIHRTPGRARSIEVLVPIGSCRRWTDGQRAAIGAAWCFGTTMRAHDDLEVVSFITLQDLIVSFAVADDEPGEITSLTLLRTPKHEAFLPAAERGVNVSHESFPEKGDEDLLRRFTMTGSVIRLETLGITTI